MVYKYPQIPTFKWANLIFVLWKPQRNLEWGLRNLTQVLEEQAWKFFIAIISQITIEAQKLETREKTGPTGKCHGWTSMSIQI